MTVGDHQPWDAKDDSGREIIGDDNAISKTHDEPLPTKSVSTFYVFDQWANEEFKFVRKSPMFFANPKPDENYKLFFSVLFGQFDALALEKRLQDHPNVDLKTGECNLDNFIEYYHPNIQNSTITYVFVFAGTTGAKMASRNIPN